MAKGFLTYSTTVILQAIANGYLYGFDIIDITGMPGGTVYPALRRLDEAGLSHVRMGEAEHRAVGAAAAAEGRRADARGTRGAGRRDQALSPRGPDAAAEKARAQAVASLRNTVALRPHLRLIALLGLIVPRRLRADWRQEWETELRHRERLLADWDRLDWRNRLDLLRRSSSAFRDALWLQKKRLEADVFQDLRYGVRMLRTHPGFTAVAVVTLALGIGANTAIFSILDKLLIRTLPVDEPHRLVAFVSDANGEPGIFSYPAYANLRDQNNVLSGLVAFVQRPFTVSDGTMTERVTGEIVSGNYFDVLGVRPALGRFFLPEEDRTPGLHAVVVIGARAVAAALRRQSRRPRQDDHGERPPLHDRRRRAVRVQGDHRRPPCRRSTSRR